MRIGVLGEPFGDVEALVGGEVLGILAPRDEARVLGVLLPAPVLAGEHAAGEREVGHEHDVEPLAHREDVALDRTVEQAVVVLRVDEARHAEVVGDRLGLGELLAGEVGAADLAHLPGGDELGERRQRLADGGLRIGLVEQVEVDVVACRAGPGSRRTPS